MLMLPLLRARRARLRGRGIGGARTARRLVAGTTTETVEGSTATGIEGMHGSPSESTYREKGTFAPETEEIRSGVRAISAIGGTERAAHAIKGTGSNALVSREPEPTAPVSNGKGPGDRAIRETGSSARDVRIRGTTAFAAHRSKETVTCAGSANETTDSEGSGETATMTTVTEPTVGIAAGICGMSGCVASGTTIGNTESNERETFA
ncbi:MAG: hypothetical protein J5I65_10470 [Aridibacter famidurans]|nr:hypothetical protein [Aridibacter famidurans]